jgi:uncharacterized repeat protein (TIGR01451 family)
METAMTTIRFTSVVRRWLAALLLACGLSAGADAAAACTTTGACLSAGPRLASVDTAKSALLNPLLGGLLATDLSLTAVDWNTLATGEVNLLGFLNALQAQANVSSPAQALNANVTLAQVAAALGVQARAQVNTSLSGVLATLAAQLGSAGATVRVGDLVKVTADAGTLAKTTVNSLDMLTGLVQLYNKRNVLTTPQPVGISGGVLGMLGILNSVQLYAQVIEPAVYMCGPTGSTFHSAAIRVKLKLDLVTLAPVTDALTALLGKTEIAIGQLDVYVEIGRGEGTLKAVDAVNRAVTLQASPGVADVYLGKIADGVFFNRSRALTAADVDYGKVGTLSALGLSLLDIEIKASARGQAPLGGSTVTMSGTFPQTRTVSSSTVFVTNLVNGLLGTLDLRIPQLNLGTLLNGTVTGLVKGIVKDTLTPVLAPVLTGVADPLLQLLGVGLGQMVVTVNGICEACDEFRLQKAVDKANAAPGSSLTYTITYRNTGSTTLNNLKIVDATPAFTVFGAGACGTLGAGLTGCTVSGKPGAGAAGTVEWTFTGTLAPGATGTVTLSVMVQ